MAGTIWKSPDGHITKKIVCPGIWGLKPTENCECVIRINEETPEKLTSPNSVIIGNAETFYDRLLDQCLLTMCSGEVANFSFTFTAEHEYGFTLELQSFKSSGLIYEWDAKQKYNLALKHKEQGNALYNKLNHIDASQRFGKGLKILCSIPVEVDEPPDEIDGMKVEVIQDLKVKLYNNLASCYLKHCDYETALKLCSKVLESDSKNVKALYKQAVAQCETHDYEGSQKSLRELLQYDPDNKAASTKLQFVNTKVAENNAKVNAMIKRMFEK